MTKRGVGINSTLDGGFSRATTSKFDFEAVFRIFLRKKTELCVLFLFNSLVDKPNKKNYSEDQKGNNDFVENPDVRIKNCDEENQHKR